MNKSHTVVVLLALVVLCAILVSIGQVEAKLSCAKLRTGYKCVGGDRDEPDAFSGTITNTYSTDVKVDLMNVVDLCEKVRSSPLPFRSTNSNNNNNNSTRGDGQPKRPRSTTVLSRRADRGLVIPRGGKIPVNMDRVKVPGYCSKVMIKNCRTASNFQMDCSQLISIR